MAGHYPNTAFARASEGRPQRLPQLCGAEAARNEASRPCGLSKYIPLFSEENKRKISHSYILSSSIPLSLEVAYGCPFLLPPAHAHRRSTLLARESEWRKNHQSKDLKGIQTQGATERQHTGHGCWGCKWSPPILPVSAQADCFLKLSLDFLLFMSSSPRRAGRSF